MLSNSVVKNDITQPRVLEGKVWTLFDRGDLRSALGACQQLNQDFPAFASGWRTASQLALKMNNAAMALKAIECAVELQPENPEWLLQKGICVQKLGLMVELKVLVELLVKEQWVNAYQFSTLGLLFTHLDEHEKAVHFYRKAAECEPKAPQHYYNLASVYRFLGDIELADEHYSKAIALNSHDYEAFRLRSELRTQTLESNHINELSERIGAGNINPRGEPHLYYALAKELEDIGDYERSFHFLTKGADSRRRGMKYSPESDIKAIDTIRSVFTKDFFDGRVVGCDNKEPIFILGLPRSGTTLVERIIGSHENVFSAGELNNFSIEMVRQIQLIAGNQKVPKDQIVGLSAGVDFKQLGQSYVESTRPLTGHTPCFIDKLPLNYLYVGLIHLALPKAKIINLMRSPMDSCYAMYKQLFKDAYPFSYNLKELGNYYLAYRRLMDHWNTVMPGVIYTVHYENLVRDVESESKKLLEFCDLPWDENCLKFYENKQASTTASAVQVREPVYARSVSRWKNYQSQLQPLIEVLEAGGIQVDI